MRLFEGTEWDRPPRCDRCNELEQDCQCPPAPAPPPTYRDPATQTAHLAVEKRKRGKKVVVISGLPPTENDLPALLAKIKSQCGVGGTVKDDTLEIQGNQLDRVRDLLTDIGFRCRG